MNSSKRKIIIGGIVAVLGIALLAYVVHVLTAALDSQPGDVSKAQFVVQLGADEKLTNAAADRTLTLDFGEPFTHAPTGRTLPQLVTVTDVYHLKNTGSEELSRRLTDFGVQGRTQITFLIGGSVGLDEELKRQADWRLSMSPMTFPHHMARIMLLEQIYRAYQIAGGAKYHK